MAREGLMDDCGYHGFDECARYEECCDEAYERGRADMLNEFTRYLANNSELGNVAYLYKASYLSEQLKEQK